jgi:hypothetical protein
MIFAKQISIATFFTMVLSAGVAPLGSSGSFFIADAQARPGRPASPTSVAGVARRTTRRTVRRTTRYVTVLPTGCTTVVVENVTLTQCGTTYYQAHGTQWVVVVVD